MSSPVLIHQPEVMIYSALALYCDLIYVYYASSLLYAP